MHEHDSKQRPYEVSDVNIKGVLVAALILTVGVVGAFVLMAGTYRWFEARDRTEAAETMPTTLIPADDPGHPPEPVLQGAPGSRFELRDPVPEMNEMREREDFLLATPGWIDEDAGRVRLPIERAKQLLLERELPVRSTGGAP